MRRREYLRSAVGAAGLAGLSASALQAAANPATNASGSPNATGSPDATTQSFEPLGRVDVTNTAARFQATEAVTTPDGEHAFVSKLDGFHVVDVSDPAAPEIVATRENVLADEGGPMTQIMDLKYNRDRVLLATDRGSRYEGIAVFDVRDRTDPRLVTAHPTGYPIHNCHLYGDHAYLSTGSALDVVDVTADEPSSVATWQLTDYDEAYADVPSFLWNLHDLYVQNDRAYLAYWDGGTWILDVSDPAAPTHVGHVRDQDPEELAGLDRSEVSEAVYEPPGNDHYVQPNDDGTLLAVGKESWDVEGDSIEEDEPDDEDQGGPSGIALWDVEDATDPTHLSTIEPPQPPEGETARREGGYFTTSHNFDVVGDYLYSSWYRAGVKVHDISDPANPEELSHWENGAETSIWTAQVAVPGEFFVASTHGNLPEGRYPGGLLTFPDPTDNDATITPAGPDVTIPTPTPTASPTPTEESTPTQTDSATATPVPTEEPTPSPAPTAMPTDEPTATGPGTATGTETSSGGGPGFGPLAALSGLGVGAWRLLGARGADGDEER